MRDPSFLSIAGVSALAMMLGTATASAANREAWTVNGGSKSVTIIDSQSESVVQTIPLDQSPGAAEPTAIAFSTLDGQGGDFAFVAQGSTIQVIRVAAAGVTHAVDLGSSLGLPVTVVDIAAAQSREFDVTPPTTVKAYLYVAATVATGGSTEPYYFVLDQDELVIDPSPMPVVDFGPLLSSLPPGDRGVASGVSVLGARKGEQFQRVWFATRSPVADTMRIVLLTKGELLSSPWTVATVQEQTLSAGAVAPDRFRVATPHDRELPILPTDGKLVNLDTGDECSLPGDVRDIAIAGPGPGAYQILAVDALQSAVLRVNPVTCSTESFAVGAGPTAVAIETISQHGKAFVASRDTDTVTILRLDGTTTEIALGPGGGGPCTECPEDIESRRCCDGCTLKNAVLSVINGVDDRLTWKPIGCLGCEVAVYCQCQNPNDTECPCYCPPPDPDPDSVESAAIGDCYSQLPPDVGGAGPTLIGFGPETESPWKQLGITATTSYTHVGAAPEALRYAVLPIVP